MTATTQTARGPAQVAAAGDVVWVYTVQTHAMTTLEPVAGASPAIYLTSRTPVITSDGHVVVVAGIERVSLIGADLSFRQLALHSRTADAIAIAASGDVVIAGGHELMRIRIADVH